MRKIKLLLPAFIFIAALTACGDKAPDIIDTEKEPEVSVTVSVSDVQTEVSVSTTVSEEKQEDEAELAKKAAEAAAKKYDYALNSSIFSTGNNYRLKKVIEKARSGEVVNIAALGGSVTEGAGATDMHKGYAYLFADAFKKTYCSKDNLNYVNAGLSGTPSSLGVMRYEKDVLEPLGCAPDLLIIEYAVNDYGEVTNGRAYESLAYQALTENEDCAVILLFSVSSQLWTMQTNMIPTGTYYKLPMVSLKYCFDYAKISVDDYFYDEYHPSQWGHQVMANCLMRLLEKVDEETPDESFPIPEEAKSGRDFTNMKLVFNDGSLSKFKVGSFDKVDNQVQQMAFKWIPSFPDNFQHGKDSGNKPLTLTLDCSHVLINYKTANDKSFGEAELYVDGKLVNTMNGYSAGGWNNCNVIIAVDEAASGKHKIEIKMAPGNEEKLFTIYAIAYNK